MPPWEVERQRKQEYSYKRKLDTNSLPVGLWKPTGKPFSSTHLRLLVRKHFLRFAIYFVVWAGHTLVSHNPTLACVDTSPFATLYYFSGPLNVTSLPPGGLSQQTAKMRWAGSETNCPGMPAGCKRWASLWSSCPSRLQVPSLVEVRDRGSSCFYMQLAQVGRLG